MLFVLFACVAADPAPTDTSVGPAGIVPPTWFEQSAYGTVDPERGLRWAKDEDFQLTGFAVPQIFVGPEGRIGMLVTNMRKAETIRARWLLWSDDGETWNDDGVPLMFPRDVPYPCGERLEDAAVWRESPDTWTVVFEGTDIPDAPGISPDPRYFCPAVTSDLQSWTWDDAPMWAGATADDRVSVPAVLPVADGDALLFYNGDILRTTPAGPGIRVATLSGHQVTPRIVDPILPPERVDPMPVYLTGGGVRLYHSRFMGGAGETGLRTVDLGDDLLPVDDGALLLPSPGECDDVPTGECYFDPSFLALPDGTLYLYFTDAVWDEDGRLHASIGRAIATD